MATVGLCICNWLKLEASTCLLNSTLAVDVTQLLVKFNMIQLQLTDHSVGINCGYGLMVAEFWLREASQSKIHSTGASFQLKV